MRAEKKYLKTQRNLACSKLKKIIKTKNLNKALAQLFIAPRVRTMYNFRDSTDTLKF